MRGFHSFEKTPPGGEVCDLGYSTRSVLENRTPCSAA